MKDPRLVQLEAQLRRNLPYMDPACELAQDIARYGAEEGIARAARECLRRIDGELEARRILRDEGKL